MKMTRTWFLMFQFIFIVACIFHVINLSVTYFEYPTSKKSSSKYPLNVQNYYFSICFPIPSENIGRRQANQTLDEFLKLFPPKEKFIDWCSFRLEENDTFASYDGFDKCSEFFSVEP